MRYAILPLLLLLSACAYFQTSEKEIEDADLMAANYQAADKLLENAKVPLSRERNLVVATFVNIDDLEDSSTLGRLIAEHLASRLVQKGYRVVELKLRNNIFIKQRAGEFMLSRSVQDVSTAHDAQAVVAGTYAIARNQVFVNARIIQPEDSTIIASYDYVLPLGKNLRALVYTRR
ncbi:MAG: hypothetical protein D6819_02990 [Gammaproteobacteria bacterium]|nr:MAG: hypothetical protein D6819_02990 [Gammaproteobacteria bacterium]